MSKKLLIGISLVLLAILYGLQVTGYINGETIKFLLNYQVILILVGLFVALLKKKASGWVIVAVGAYLYIKEFFEKFANIGITIGLLIAGIGLITSSILDKKQKTKDEAIKLKSTNINKKNNTENEE